MTAEGGATVLACSRCARAVEVCSGCDRDDCPVVVCYSCLAITLGVSLEQPHEHGG